MIRALQIDKLRGLLAIKRTDKFPNAQIRQLCGVMKGLMKASMVVRPCGEDGEGQNRQESLCRKVCW